MNRRKRRRKRMIRLGVLCALLIAAATVVFLFRVKTVHVFGNSRYSGEEIQKGLIHNFLTQNTLYLQWQYRNGQAPDTMPFLGSLHVKMRSPFEIDVQVTEKELVGYVDMGSSVYFDQEGVVLEITDEVYPDLPVVTGATIGEPSLYQKLPTESSAQLRTILSVTQLLRYQGLTAKEIRFSENGDITVYVGGVEARLGQDEYLEEKIANLRAIVNNLGSDQGTLHLESFTGKNELTTLTPFDETESETWAQDGGPDGSGSGDGSGTVDGTGTGDGSGADGTGTGDGSGSADGAGTGDGSGNADGSGAGNGSGADGSGTGSGSGADGTGAGDGSSNADGSGTGGGNGADGTGTGDGSGNADGSGAGSADDGSGVDDSQDGTSSNTIAMVFNSSGTLVYNVHIENGVVVDSYGNQVPGCSVDENGYVVDAYMNVIDPATGALMN